MKRILVGTDGSVTAAQAVSRAAELAGATGAELIVLNAYQRPAKESSAREILDPVVAELKKKKLKVRALAVEGHPAEAILDAAESEEVDLVVLGNKGMTGARRFLLGGVPNKVSHNTRSNLLIVKTT